MHGTRLPSSTNTNPPSISIRIARDPNDLMLVTAIRAAVYLAEQDCPIEEEFDGNDLVAAHFIGFVGTEPAGCLRVRFFGEFAKVERLAVRRSYAWSPAFRRPALPRPRLRPQTFSDRRLASRARLLFHS